LIDGNPFRVRGADPDALHTLYLSEARRRSSSAA
jgi:hypothetical protein